MTDVSERENVLKMMKVCRFCLSQQSETLENIFSRNLRLKVSAPLPMQVMSCASIEVYTNDGMPHWVCIDCRLLFEHNYRFKQMCKRAETLLRQFPLTGQWPSPLPKPKVPPELVDGKVKLPTQEPNSNSTITTIIPTKQTAVPLQLIKVQTDSPNQPSQRVQLQPIPTLNESQNKSSALSPQPQATMTRMKIVPHQIKIVGSKKLLNSNPAASPEPPAPIRMKKEKLEDETSFFLDKVDNDEELSMDDVQRLIAAAGPEEEFISISNVSSSKPSSQKPKLLNKSSIRILNKDAEVVVEPRLSKPQLTRDEDGNVAIVTEILDPNTPYETEPEPDPIKTAEPIETNVFPCPHCERSFPLRQLRDIHMVNHNRERSFQCADCEKSFFSKYDLQKHSFIHTGDRPYKCSICDKGFTRATLLHRHEKTHTDIPKYICIYCEKPFISKDEMEKHAERHRKNRPYQCKHCTKSFAFKQGLERHEVVHSREQPYPCQYCDSSFSTPSKLARHLTAHAGKRPYPCKFCPKSFLLSHHLSRHLRSHKQGTVAFMCTRCDKVYKTRDELIYHSAVHATESLECPLCKEHFSDVAQVGEHIKEHVEGEAHACEFCDMIFITGDRLQNHTEQEHADEMVAYHEDVKAKALNTKEQIEEEQTVNVSDIQSIEEYLIDDLPVGMKILNNQNVSEENIGVVKEEMASKRKIAENKQKAKVINNIVVEAAEDMDSVFVDDDSNVSSSDEELAVTEEAPPVKTRKVVANNNNNTETVAVPAKTDNQQMQTRRRVATAAALSSQSKASPAESKTTSPVSTKTSSATTKTSKDSPVLTKTIPAPSKSSSATVSTSPKRAVPQRQPGKAEKKTPSAEESRKTDPKQPLINKVLNSLPKSLSVRKNIAGDGPAPSPTTVSPSTRNSATTSKSPGTPKDPISSKSQPVSVIKQSTGKLPTPLARAGRAPEKETSSTPELNAIRSVLKNRQVVLIKRPQTAADGKESAATTATTSTPISSLNAAPISKQVVNMMLGDKKVKVQKITMSKAEANAMRKEGRLRTVDGNMVLTTHIKSARKST